MRTRTRSASPRGAATLVAVMLLGLIVAMVAAYGQRSQVFEQRIAVNQVRAAQAGEAAEAGLHWALARLNGGPVDAQCRTVSAAGAAGFRERQLVLDGDTGAIVPRQPPGAEPPSPGCVFDGTGWSCHCPDDGPAMLREPDGVGPFPAFRVRFVAGPQAGQVRVESVGCTGPDAGCLAPDGQAGVHAARARVSALLALRPALAARPAAALTVRGDVTPASGTTLTAVATDGSGPAVHAGGRVDGTAVRAQTRAGTPARHAVASDDPWLAGLTTEGLFVQLFGVAPPAWRGHAAVRELACSPACSARALRDAATAHPDGLLRVQGDVVLDEPLDLGSATQPLVLVVDGRLRFDAPARLHGLVHVAAPQWEPGGPGEVRGAVVAEGSVTGTASLTIAHDTAVLRRLQHRHGTFALVPGSWRDLP